jgi:nitrogen fixation/metabolism regulation signal transduction histidine kinase
MKKNKIVLLTRLVAVAALSAGGAVAIFFEMPWVAALAFGVLIFVALSIFRIWELPVRQMKRLIMGIRFEEFNISFSRPSTTNSPDEELYRDMEQAIRKFSERMQHRERELGFYDLLLNMINLSIFVVNARGEIVWINKRALDMSGNPRPRTLSDLDRLAEGLSTTMAAMSAHDIRNVDIELDGTEYKCIVTLSNIESQNETFRVFVLKEMRPFIEETESRAWEKLIRTLTHEIMNSITPIVSLSESFATSNNEGVERPHRASDMQKALEVIHRRSRGLIKFVNDYKQLTHLPTPEKQTFEIAGMLRDISELMRSQDLGFEWEVVPVSLRLFADRTLLEQAILNFVKNGFEACEDIENPQVKVSARHDNSGRTVIAISDNGSGILPEVMDKMFTPFYTTRPNGSGIGLPLSRQIVTAHGGSLHVTSEVGHGSTFTITI